MKQTGYCLKCKKKVQPKDATTEEKCPDCGQMKCTCKEASVEFWSKEASQAVAKALISEVEPDDADDAPEAEPVEDESPAKEEAPAKEEKKEEAPAPAPVKKDDDVEAKKAEDLPPIPEKKKEDAPVKKEEAPAEVPVEKEKEPADPIQAGQNEPKYFYTKGKKSMEEKTPAKEEVPEDKKAPKAESVVNTNMLAASDKFDDLGLVSGNLVEATDIADLTADEKAKLDQLFQ